MQHKTWGNNDCIILWDQKSNTRPGSMNVDEDNAGTGEDSHKFSLGQVSFFYTSRIKENTEQPTLDL